MLTATQRNILESLKHAPARIPRGKGFLPGLNGASLKVLEERGLVTTEPTGETYTVERRERPTLSSPKVLVTLQVHQYVITDAGREAL